MWLQLLAMHDHSFVLKHGIRLTRLSSVAVWQVINFIDLTSII